MNNRRSGKRHLSHSKHIRLKIFECLCASWLKENGLEVSLHIVYISLVITTVLCEFMWFIHLNVFKANSTDIGAISWFNQRLMFDRLHHYTYIFTFVFPINFDNISNGFSQAYLCTMQFIHKFLYANIHPQPHPSQNDTCTHLLKFQYKIISITNGFCITKVSR